MKRYWLISVVFAAVLLVSCSIVKKGLVEDMFELATAGGTLLGQLHDIMFCPGMRNKPDMINS